MSKKKVETTDEVETLLETVQRELDSLDDVELLTEGITISSRNPRTTNATAHQNFDEMWKDVRSIFRLTDKIGEQVIQNGKADKTTKAVLVAAGLEIRRQVKTNQKDLARLRRDLEKESKAIKKQGAQIHKEIKEFKKMVDLYMNPPREMGPISRKTLRPYKGVEKKN